MTVLIYVHGINNEDNTTERIRDDWTEALSRGATDLGRSLPSGITFKVAFYGDLLAKETKNWGKLGGTTTPMSAVSPVGDFVDGEVASLYKAIQERAGVSDEQVVSYLDAEDIPAATRQADGIHKRWIKALARALEDILPTKGKYIAKLFLKQAAAYLHKPGLKEKIDKLVAAQVFDGLNSDTKVVVVAHSLGTVVSYDILRHHMDGVNIALLLTAGSPLGIDIVKARLGPPLILPPNVGKWVNASDPEDFVALHPELNSCTFGSAQIENLPMLNNGRLDAHDIRKYLKHPEVVSNILNATI